MGSFIHIDGSGSIDHINDSLISPVNRPVQSDGFCIAVHGLSTEHISFILRKDCPTPIHYLQCTSCAKV